MRQSRELAANATIVKVVSVTTTMCYPVGRGIVSQRIHGDTKTRSVTQSRFGSAVPSIIGLNIET